VNVSADHAPQIQKPHHPDSKMGQIMYLGHLMEIVQIMNGKNGFTNTTRTGMKITSDTFSDAKKVSSEVVQRVILMLLVHFGLMSKDETIYGLLRVSSLP
jgi:hypothetical protein